MENRKNLLVTLADKNYIQQAKQLFSSVYWNAGWKGDYLLLAHEIPEEELKWFTDKGILIKKCNPLYNGTMGDGNYSVCVIDKFYLFTEEFKKWEHIVFLDADIIVRAPLDNLAKTKAFSSPQTCIKNFITYFDLSECKELSILKKEYNLRRTAFNSGVISFDTNIIKADTFNKLMTIFNKYENICNGDDTVLNLFFYDQWIKIPLVYNVLVNQIGLKKYKAIILHFQRLIEYYPLLWNPKNYFYQEWKINLERAEFIDLNKIQNVKKWNIFKIKYYSLIISLFIYIPPYRLKKYFLVYELKSFFCYELKSFFLYIINAPDKLIGKIGVLIKKKNPGLYHKLRKIKGGK